MPDPTELLKRMEAKKKAGQVPGAQADTSAAAPVPPPTSPADTQVAPEKPVAVPAAPKAPRPKPAPAPAPAPPPVDPESVVAARNAAAEKAIGSTVGPPWDPSAELDSYAKKSAYYKLVDSGLTEGDAAERVKAMSEEELAKELDHGAWAKDKLKQAGKAVVENTAGAMVGYPTVAALKDWASRGAPVAPSAKWGSGIDIDLNAIRDRAIQAAMGGNPEELRRLADEMEKK